MTKQTKWSPEPWRYVDPDGGIDGAEGWKCAEAWPGGPPTAAGIRRQRANARRIVACVNALAGASTEVLESWGTGELWAAFKREMDKYEPARALAGKDGTDGR